MGSLEGKEMVGSIQAHEFSILEQPDLNYAEVRSFYSLSAGIR
jgi:hypothetical protein